MGFETSVAPRLFEAVRQHPARRNGLPPPLAWRRDAFHLLWHLQASSLQGAVGGLLGLALFRTALTTGALVSHWGALVAIGLNGLVALIVTVKMTRSTMRLGSCELLHDPSRTISRVEP